MTHAPLNELMRQHELDFFAPADCAPAARPLGRARLLILACSSSKAEGEGLAARDRYTGPLWQTLKAADPDGSLAHIAFLSARYGFGDAREPLPHYNTVLTAKAADTMIERGLGGFYPNYDLSFRTQGARDRHLANRERLRTAGGVIARLVREAGCAFEDVAICGGKEYVRVAEAFVSEMTDHHFIAAEATVTIINDQIGFMRAKLRRWLSEP
jgi:hypothetical protein